jgi:hypothetical protein
VITFQDLERKYPSLEALDVLGTSGYERWAEGLPFEPSLDDFVKFEEKPKDPTNPLMGTILVVARDENGKVVRDKAAYEAAMTKYLSTMEAERRHLGQSERLLGRKLRRPRTLTLAAGTFNKNVFNEASKVRIESSVPANGKPQFGSQNLLDYGNSSVAGQRSSGSEGVGVQARSAKPGKKVLREVTDEDLERNGSAYLYYSPKEISKFIDQFEAEL